MLLHKNALLPWFILVPETSGTELLALPDRERNRVMRECTVMAAFIQRHFHSTKINFAALGNQVPQLHLHIVGRKPGDACWPRPVWGNLSTASPYSAAELETIRSRWRTTCEVLD